MVGTPKELIRWLLLQPEDAKLECLPYKERRSKNANAYALALIQKIADALRSDKNTVYLEMLDRYGQSEIVSVVSTVNVRGLFKYYNELGKGYVNGKEFTHYKVYKGSSEYDTKEMSILIDGIVDEAKSLNIETLTPSELQRLKDDWG